MRNGLFPPLVDPVRRIFAAGCAALVFALGLFAASPALHRQVHLDDHSADDHCAIVLFSGGVSLAPAVAVPAPPVADRREERPFCSVEIFPGSPRYLLQPGRGPPAA